MKRSWFKMPGREGVVSLERQIAGLGLIAEQVRGKTALDLGCAEGEISRWMSLHGAARVDGIDYDAARIQVGRSVEAQGVRLACADLNAGPPLGLLAAYDVVLLLAVLQKLRDPAALLAWASACCREWLAVRAPHPVLSDRRSGFVPLDIKAALSGEFELVQETDGFPGYGAGEAWLGIFHRC